MVAALQAVNSAAALASDASASSIPKSVPATAGQEPFGSLLKTAVGQVDQLEQQASAAVTGLMTGTGVDVHQAMIASEKASMAFEMVLAVRNKAIQSYQSVMSMQF